MDATTSEIFPVYKSTVKKCTQIKFTNVIYPEELLVGFKKWILGNGNAIVEETGTRKFKIILNPEVGDNVGEESMGISVRVYRVDHEEGSYIVDFTRKEGGRVWEFYEFFDDVKV